MEMEEFRGELINTTFVTLVLILYFSLLFNLPASTLIKDTCSVLRTLSTY